MANKQIQIQVENGKVKTEVIEIPKIEIPASRRAKVIDKLRTARINMLLNAPFFGSLACRLTLIPADDWVDTAATDGRNFYYNHDFVEKLNGEELVFLFGHEVLHNVYGHTEIGGRVGDRDKRLANVAMDYAINLDLVKHRIGKFPTSVEGLLDHKYEGMCFEEIYDLLNKQRKEKGKNGMSDSDLDDLLDKLLDKHLEPGEGKDGKETGSATDRASLRDEMRAAIISAAQTCKNAGDLPLGVQRIIGQLTAPKMDWKQILNQHLESTNVYDHSWMKISRLGWDLDAILPGMLPGSEINCTVAIDMSGSIGQEQARAFLSEVQGIMDQFDEYKIHVFTYDTKVYNHKIFSSDGFEDIRAYEPMGGGGTDFNCIYEYLKDNDLKPDQLLNFTDMYPGGSWGDESYCSTIFCSISKGIEAPFGTTIYVGEAQ